MKEKWARKLHFLPILDLIEQFWWLQDDGVHVISMGNISKCKWKMLDGCRAGIVPIFIPDIQLMALGRYWVLSQGSMHKSNTIN